MKFAPPPGMLQAAKRGKSPVVIVGAGIMGCAAAYYLAAGYQGRRSRQVAHRRAAIDPRLGFRAPAGARSIGDAACDRQQPLVAGPGRRTSDGSGLEAGRLSLRRERCQANGALRSLPKNVQTVRRGYASSVAR